MINIVRLLPLSVPPFPDSAPKLERFWWLQVSLVFWTRPDTWRLISWTRIMWQESEGTWLAMAYTLHCIHVAKQLISQSISTVTTLTICSRTRSSWDGNLRRIAATHINTSTVPCGHSTHNGCTYDMHCAHYYDNTQILITFTHVPRPPPNLPAP